MRRTDRQTNEGRGHPTYLCETNILGDYKLIEYNEISFDIIHEMLHDYLKNFMRLTSPLTQASLSLSVGATRSKEAKDP